jgi:hypothetical protein
MLMFFCIAGCGNIGGQFGHPGEPEVRQGELPPFPTGWPPPKASSYYNVPDKFLRDKSSVGEAVGAIASALARSGYTEVSYYGTKDGGVALVTRMERIAEDGSALPNIERWSDGEDSGQDLLKMIRKMYFLERGRFRIFVFFLGPTDFSDDKNKTLTRDAAKQWEEEGKLPLPDAIADRPLGKAHCTVALYEFESTGRAVTMVPASKIPVGLILQQNGLLASLESKG